MTAKLSRNETIKETSNFLRGTIAEGLAERVSGAIAEDDTQLTKFHGIYQQDDRDLRPERAKKKMEKAFIFMARLRVPGGVLGAAAMDRHARHGRRARQRHVAPDHAADHPVPRHHQEQPEAGDPGDPRRDARHHRRLRRREPQRDLHAQPLSRRHPRRGAGDGAGDQRASAAALPRLARNLHRRRTRGRRRGGGRTDPRPHLSAPKVQDRHRHSRR